MTFYIEGPAVTDPNVLKQRAVDYLEGNLPAGWTLAPGDPLDLMLDAFSFEAATQSDVINTLLDSAFRYFGLLVSLPPIDAIAATGTCTFTVQDTAGYTIPAGSVVALTDPNGNVQGFDLLADVIIAPGSSTGAGVVSAETAGTAANGLSGTVQLVQVPPFVTAATLAATTGGIDAELDSTYLSRLSETLTLLSPRPVLPADFAVLARSVAGVYRATGVDLLKPGPPYDISAEATGQEKNMTVAVTDINGAAVGSTIRGNVQTFLQSLREQNFKVWVVDPQYSSVDVTATVYAWPGVDTTVLQAQVVAALTTLLSPASFSLDSFGSAQRWVNDPKLRQSAVFQTIMLVPGVRYAGPVTFGLHGGALGTADVTLGPGSSIPALPTVGTLSITVNATT